VDNEECLGGVLRARFKNGELRTVAKKVATGIREKKITFVHPAKRGSRRSANGKNRGKNLRETRNPPETSGSGVPAFAGMTEKGCLAEKTISLIPFGNC
jgi:single-stranded DNA-specific DHH superfamily exonuclease